jgi:hypothetical protein
MVIFFYYTDLSNVTCLSACANIYSLVYLFLISIIYIYSVLFVAYLVFSIDYMSLASTRELLLHAEITTKWRCAYKSRQKKKKFESHLNPWESHQQRTIIIISSCQVIPEAKYPGRMNLVMSGSMRCKSYQKVDYSFLILHLVKRDGWLAFKADRRIYQKKSCGRRWASSCWLGNCPRSRCIYTTYFI